VTRQSLLSGRDGVTLMVGGETALSGARVQATHDKVELGNGPISQETLNGRDYRRASN